MKRLTKEQASRKGGRIGGKATTPAKQTASRRNGAKGGRPRKVTLLIGPNAERVTIESDGPQVPVSTMGGGSKLTGYIVHRETK